ncbi:MAG: ABC transporter substrate-binding protein [Deltaproteobacteria bacterium]|nr:ABC transporter substrate-binding protein [Deltaproteobacteria bacterium]
MICLFSAHTWGETKPVLNKGKKWRIGYYEGGPYSEYGKTMKTLIEGLMDLGWIEKQTLPEFKGDTVKPYWSWLVHNPGNYLSFSPHNAYSADWDENTRKEVKTKLLKKLKSGSLDLVIAMGTWAGQDLANNQHNIPTIVLSTSDPIKAGIIKSVEDSGLDHVTARVDPSRYLRQLRMFHRLVGFKKLGVAYEDTADGRIYSVLDEINQVAAERGFDVVKCTIVETNVEDSIADESCNQCYQQLSRQADAVYITPLTCVDRQVENYVKIFNAHKTPTFSLVGSVLVKRGVLLSISSDSGYDKQGTYNAEKIAAILNGAKPRTLKQMLADPLDISINLNTAKKIDFPVPESLLKIAREIYAQ